MTGYIQCNVRICRMIPEFGGLVLYLSEINASAMKPLHTLLVLIISHKIIKQAFPQLLSTVKTSNHLLIVVMCRCNKDCMLHYDFVI